MTSQHPLAHVPVERNDKLFNIALVLMEVVKRVDINTKEKPNGASR